MKQLLPIPATKTVNDLRVLDNANALEALYIALHVMTNEQKNTIITIDHARITAAEYIESAIENLKG